MFFILIVPLPVFAEDWQKIYSDNQAIYCIDFDSIEIYPYSKIIITFKESGEYKYNVVGTQYPWDKSFKTYCAKRQLNCTDQTVINLEVDTYDEKGQSVINYTAPGEPAMKIEVSKTAQFIYDRYCTKNYPQKSLRKTFCDTSETALKSKLNYWKDEHPEFKVTNESFYTKQDFQFEGLSPAQSCVTVTFEY